MLITTFRGLAKYVYFLGINPAPQNTRLITKSQQHEKVWIEIMCNCSNSLVQNAQKIYG
jgi:hypothetical protein